MPHARAVTRAGPASPRRKAKAGEPGAGERRVAQNRRARHDYDILETFECGIALQGSEVKSLRAGMVVIRDSYARIEDGEVWLLGVHVSPYAQAVGFGSHDPDRPRKLLLHRRQIDHLLGQVKQQSLTLVPLSIYFRDGRAKVELALARGRKTYDKRAALAERDAAMDVARALRRDGRGD
ncbi:MAG: SsrA-binding protein SmpB [Acidimicrobiales bacterium]